MLNIFNLFLFLLLLWLMFMLFAGNLSIAYLAYAILFSGLISWLSYKTKLITKESELLFLSLGFYRHFTKTYFKNILKSLILLLRLAFDKKTIRPLIYSIEADYKNKFNPTLLITTLSMSTGIFCVKIKDNIFYIHSIEEKYFNELNLFKIKKVLPNINDDNLV